MSTKAIIGLVLAAVVVVGFIVMQVVQHKKKK